MIIEESEDWSSNQGRSSSIIKKIVHVRSSDSGESLVEGSIVGKLNASEEIHQENIDFVIGVETHSVADHWELSPAAFIISSLAALIDQQNSHCNHSTACT